ncbi:MAG: hypothetical protein AAF389_18805 [Gemmatimonadota bacterium]
MSSRPYRWRTCAHVFGWSWLLVGCHDVGPTTPTLERSAAVHPIRAPRISESDLVRTRHVRTTPASASATRQEVQVHDPFEYIFDPESHAQVTDDYAIMTSSHDYNTNYSSIESTLNVAKGDKQVGSQTLLEQRSIFFPFHFGLTRTLRLNNRASVDRACGFSASGRASHKAWWGLLGSKGLVTWGLRVTPSVALAARGGCEGATGTRGGTTREGGGIVCTVLITYDLDTLEVVNVDVLSCSSGGGTEI